MITIHRVTTRALALALLMLGSCMRNTEQPTPTTSRPDGLNLAALKQAFLNKKYDQQLVQEINNLKQPDSHWT